MNPQHGPATWIGCGLLALLTAVAPAEVFSDFSYIELPGGIVITDYPVTATGDVQIPAEIDGRSVVGIDERAFDDCSLLDSVSIPSSVTGIGDFAFSNCSGLEEITIDQGVASIGDAAFNGCSSLTSITLPASVTSIGDSAFKNCTALLEILVAPGSITYSSLNGVLFNAYGSVLVEYPQGRSGAYVIPTGVHRVGNRAFTDCVLLTEITIPISVSQIGDHAFAACTGLTSISIPRSVISIEQYGFAYCTGLGSVIIPANVSIIGDRAFDDCSTLACASFAGDAPTMGTGVFDRTADGFTIHYLPDKTGFSTPTWYGHPSHGYPAMPIDAADFPAAPWLLKHHLAFDTDLHQDLNGDGIDLLLAYAFNLDPHHNTIAAMPRLVMEPTRMTLTYYELSPGVTYRPEASYDLVNWSTSGVIKVSYMIDGYRTVRVNRSGPRRFLRIVVED